jgi:hypothetical protein
VSPDTHRIYNRRRQPVELHLIDHVVTIAPGGSADVTLGDERPPQLAQLERELLVDVQPLEPAPKRRGKEGK